MKDLTAEPIGMGYIRVAVGVKGWLKVKTNTESVDSLQQYSQWMLGKDGDWQQYTVEASKLAVDGLQVKFQGVDNRTAAEILRGLTVGILRKDFPLTEEDEFYWTDLIGLKVINSSGISLGEVSGLLETGAHDVLVVKLDKQETLIPFVAQYVGEVDINNKLITVDWELDS